MSEAEAICKAINRLNDTLQDTKEVLVGINKALNGVENAIHAVAKNVEYLQQQ